MTSSALMQSLPRKGATDAPYTTRTPLKWDWKNFERTSFFPVQPVSRNNCAFLLQIAVNTKLTRFRGYRVNKRWIRANFCPLKNLSAPL